MSETAIRHPKRGKAHKDSGWRGHAWGEGFPITVCQREGRHMTERIDVSRTDPADRCKRCWPETAGER